LSGGIGFGNGDRPYGQAILEQNVNDIEFAMNVTLTPEQSKIIQVKLQSGRYQTIEEVLAQALLLLDDWDELSLTDDPAWIESTRGKVDEAVKSLAENGGTDGETAVNRLLDKFRQARESQ
jgi:antitoxin ParD1/3/4